MRSITITAFNRPDLLRRVVGSILENDTSTFTHCIVGIEPDKAEENLAEIKRLRERFDLITCLMNKTTLGVRKNPFNVLEYAFGHLNTDFNLYLEDDSLLSPDAFDFVRHYLVEYHDPKILCCNLYNYGSSYDYPTAIEKVEKFCALGFGIDQGQWHSWFERYWFDEEIRIRNGIDIGGIGGWDWSIRAVMKQYGLKVVAPMLSRSYHIGPIGVHCDQSAYDSQFRDHPWSQLNHGGFLK